MTPRPVDPVLLERIGASLRSGLRPVKPRPPAAALIAALLAIFAAVAALGAAKLGYYGVHRLTAAAIAAIVPALIAAATILAAAAVRAAIPGSKRTAHPAVLTAGASLVMAAIFAAIFPDHRTDGFVPQGISCLKAGLMWSAPAALAAWLALRRGFAVDRRAWGAAIGGLAGLAGLATLELHCPNFRMPHVVVWHTAVVPIPMLAGYFLGSKRRAAELIQ